MQNKYLKIGTMMYNIFMRYNKNKYNIQKTRRKMEWQQTMKLCPEILSGWLGENKTLRGLCTV